MKRNAQITVFIIAGLIMIIAAALVIYVETKTGVFEESIIIPEDVAPAKAYIEGCLYSVAVDAINILGQQSGFVKVPPDIIRNPNSYLSKDPGRTVVLPFWHYNGETRIPSIEYISLQIADYIDENINGCVRDLEVFSDQFGIKTGEYSIFLPVIGEEDVSIEMKYPVELSNKVTGKTTRFERYAKKVPVRLKKIHETAGAIMNAEIKQMFMENLTMDILAAEPPERIPLTDMEFRCGTRRWLVDDVRKELQSIMFYNIPRIRVKGTSYPPFEADESVYESYRTLEKNDDGEYIDPPENTPGDAYEYFHFFFDPEYMGDESLKAKFIYLPGWGMDIMVEPSENMVMSSTMMKGQSRFLAFLCMNTYHFMYDILYPVEVRIRDEASFNNRGYTFSFAFPVTIDNNKGTKDEFGVARFDSVRFDTEFCQDTGGEPVDIRVSGVDEEGYMMDELDDVNISYRCFNKACYLGKTSFYENHYRLVTQLPAGCTSPFITARKQGYLEGQAQLIGGLATVPIKRLKKMNFTVLKRPYQSVPPKGYMADEGLNEEFNETASIYISLNGTSFTQFLQYPPLPGEESVIELAEGGGAYGIDITLQQYDDIIGGYSNSKLEITAADITDADTAVFYALDYRPTPISEEQQMKMIDFMLTSNMKDELMPVFR